MFKSRSEADAKAAACRLAIDGVPGTMVVPGTPQQHCQR